MIAPVKGPVARAGCSLALTCDLVLCAESAYQRRLRQTPDLSIAGGGLLDYMNARAEGDSVGRATREAGVIGITTTAGSVAGGAVCGAIGTATLESGGWGYATCPFLVGGGGWAGQQTGQFVNDLIDSVGL